MAMSNVQTTIYKQVMQMGCRVNRGGMVTYAGDDTVTFPSGRTRKVEVKYVRADDLYRVRVVKWNPKTYAMREMVLDQVFTDSLPDIFAGEFDGTLGAVA